MTDELSEERIMEVIDEIRALVPLTLGDQAKKIAALSLQVERHKRLVECVDAVLLEDADYEDDGVVAINTDTVRALRAARAALDGEAW